MVPNVSTRWRVLALASMLFTMGDSSSGAQGSRYSLRIENRSMYDIHHLYLSSSDDRRWGLDLLGTTVHQNRRVRREVRRRGR
jgi:hypothetical protein